jgi:hypothetical protein
MVSRKACHTLLAISSLLAAAPLHEAMAQPSGDHFKCYRARVTPFVRRTVTLVDQFASSTASVVRPARFCAPADKNGEDIDDPTAHLMCYQIREAAFSRRTVLVRNQFGDQTLTVLRPESLCNPAEKNGVASQLGINHFKCYRVAGPGFAQLTVSVADQFETQSTTLLTPRLLCNPVDKNGEGIVDPAAHLTCYTIKPGGAPFTPTSINVVDQFAQQDLTVLRGECRKRSLLCVPSEKNPGGTTSSTTSSTSSSIVTTSSSTTSMTTSTSSTTSTSATTTSSTSSSTSTSMTTSTTVTTTTSLSTSTTETTSTTTPIDTTTTTTEPIVAICGNNEVEEGEGCDPPGSSCACSLGPDGICSGFCFCLMCES